MKFDRLLKLVDRAPLIMVDIYTNDPTSQDISLINYFREFRKALKAKTIQVIFLDILPVL